MLPPYLILDDAIDDPFKVIDYAKTINYFSGEKKPLKGISLFPNDMDRTEVKGGWIGFRSYPIYKHNPELNSEILSTILNKILPPKISYEYNISTYLQYTPIGIHYDYNKLWHIDPTCLMAGLLYLTPNPPSNSGTIIKLDDKEIILDNVFNRFVFYNSYLFHRPQAGFGNSIKNARLTFLVFLHHISLRR